MLHLHVHVVINSTLVTKYFRDTLLDICNLYKVSICIINNDIHKYKYCDIYNTHNIDKQILYASMYIYIVHVCIYMHVCVFVCAHVCLYVCVCVCHGGEEPPYYSHNVLQKLSVTLRLITVKNSNA